MGRHNEEEIMRVFLSTNRNCMTREDVKFLKFVETGEQKKTKHTEAVQKAGARRPCFATTIPLSPSQAPPRAFFKRAAHKYGFCALLHIKYTVSWHSVPILFEAI